MSFPSMPLPHFTAPQFVLGDYKEYVYIGEDLDAKPYIWDENLPIKLTKNTKYRLYCRIYENDVVFSEGLPKSNPSNPYVHIFIDRYEKTFSTRVGFASLISQKLMLPISEYREMRINEILE